MKVPFGQIVLASLLTIAPPHSPCSPLTSFGFTLKVLSHRLKCGGAEKGFTHNDKRQDVKKRFWSQIVEI